MNKLNPTIKKEDHKHAELDKKTYYNIL